jgi:hypothetical protein
MSDASEIHDLLNDERFDTAWSQYADSQLEYISDYNNLSYTSGSINFDLQTIRSKFVCWRDAWLSIPISITSSTGTAYTAASLLAFKQSVLDLIYGVTVSTASSQTIISDTNLSIINNLRLLVEKDSSWLAEEGSSLMFAKDTTELVDDAIGITAPGSTSETNGGFKDRIGWLKQVSAGTDTWTSVINIPLRYIHDFFDKMSFPMVNNQFQFQFLTNFYTQNAFNPFMVNSDTPPDRPLITIGGAANPYQNCRLYYKSITLSGEMQSKMAARLKAGFTKQVYFRCTDTYLPQGTTEVNVNGGGQLSRLITPNVVHPLRVWLLAPVTGGYSTHSVLGAPRGAFTNANIQVNGSNYYKNNINTPAEWYSILRDQFPGAGDSNTSGGLVAYPEFLGNYRLNCFDIRRIHERLAPNEAISLSVTAQRADAAGGTRFDYYYVVEREQCVTFNISSGSLEITVGLPGKR